MQLREFIISITMLMAGGMYVSAQDFVPDYIPNRPPSQSHVNNLPPFTTASSTRIISESNKYSTFADDVITTAKKHLGARYRRGSSGPKSFDCSGFTSYVYKKNNVPLLRSSRSQYTQGKPVSRADLQKGDLVFFSGRRRNKTVGHVGIVTDVGPGGKEFSFIHASFQGVRISKSTERYYVDRYIGARRIVNN